MLKALLLVILLAACAPSGPPQKQEPPPPPAVQAPEAGREVWMLVAWCTSVGAIVIFLVGIGWGSAARRDSERPKNR